MLPLPYKERGFCTLNDPIHHQGILTQILRFCLLYSYRIYHCIFPKRQYNYKE